MSKGPVVWPRESGAAVRLYLEFLVKALDSLAVEFPDFTGDPLGATRAFLRGDISEDELLAKGEFLWEYLIKNGAIRDFQGKQALMVRLALCLLLVRESDVKELNEHLSWFFQVLEFLALDATEPKRIMSEHFNFNKAG